MKVRILTTAAALAMTLCLQGCLSFSKHPAGVQPSAYEMRSSDYEVLGDAGGFSSSFRLFWIYQATPAVSTEEAVMEAIRSKGGDNLIQMCVSRERDIYIVGTVEGIRVTGKVIRYTNLNAD